MRTILLALGLVFLAQSAFAMGATPPPVPSADSQLSLLSSGLMTPGLMPQAGTLSQTEAPQTLTFPTAAVSPCGRR